MIVCHAGDDSGDALGIERVVFYGILESIEGNRVTLRTVVALGWPEDARGYFHAYDYFALAADREERKHGLADTVSKLVLSSPLPKVEVFLTAGGEVLYIPEEVAAIIDKGIADRLKTILEVS